MYDDYRQFFYIDISNFDENWFALVKDDLLNYFKGELLEFLKENVDRGVIEFHFDLLYLLTLFEKYCTIKDDPSYLQFLCFFRGSIRNILITLANINVIDGKKFWELHSRFKLDPE